MNALFNLTAAKVFQVQKVHIATAFSKSENEAVKRSMYPYKISKSKEAASQDKTAARKQSQLDALACCGKI